MLEGDRTHILAFLYKAIDDNQATIRFLDTKAGFGIAILGAIVGKVLLDRSQLTAFTSHGPLVSILCTLFALTALLCFTAGLLLGGTGLDRCIGL